MYKHMNVTFYKSNNAPSEYPKTFTAPVTIDCDLLEPTSTKTPTLKLSKNNTPLGYTHAELFGAKYVLVNDFTYDKGFCYIRLVRSAMDTYFATIRGCQGRITRCKDGDPYIKDGLATQREGDKITCKKIGQAFSKGTTYVFVKGVSMVK